MRGSRNERRPLLAARAALAASLVWAAPVAAEDVGPPVSLTTPATPTATAPSEQPAQIAAPADDDSIRATPLAPMDPAWIGTLGDAAHPLPETMWRGTPRTVVAAALPLLAPTTSPVLQNLSRRLLLSNAEAPQGQDPPDLAQLRVARLMALGEIDDALALLEALPLALRSEDLDRDGVELHFARNDVEGGCREVQNGIARHQGVWWDRALIACQALSGDQAKAVLGLSLLREQKVTPDPVFDALIGALGGRSAKLDKLPEPTPIRVTLVAAAKLALPAETISAADLPSLRAWAGNEAVPPLQRLAAIERAATLGALPATALAQIYGAVEFKPDELGAAIKQGKAPETPRDRALLYQVARTDPAIAVRTAALKALLADARKRGDFTAMARVVAPILADLVPSQDVASFAPDAARALYAAGQLEPAGAWAGVADPAGAPLLPVLAQLAKSGDVRPGDIDPRGIAPPAQKVLVLTLIAALGAPVQAADWAPLFGAAHNAVSPSGALWADQQQAAAAGRIGETALTTLILVRSGDHLSAEPIVLARAVAGLKSVGLEADARALAFEAALAGGI